MNLTFPFGRLFGINIRIHWLFPVVIAVDLIKGAAGGIFLFAFFAAYGVGRILTTIIHELGHCFGARSVGGHAEQILIWPLGGLAYVGHGGALKDDLKIAAMGPLTHVPMAGVCAGLLLLFVPWNWNYLNPLTTPYAFLPVQENFVPNLLLGLLKLQVELCAVNLFLPAYPLDGGRILNNLLLMRYGRVRAATVSTYFSIPIGLAIMVWSFYSQDLFFGLFGFWILAEAFQIRKMVATGQIDGHPMFGAAPEFDYMPDRPEKKGWFARWKDKRVRAAEQREESRSQADRARVDEVLDKVSREGIGSLTSAEKRVLDEASRRNRGS